MDVDGITHQCAYTDCYARNEIELVINIRTNKDITAVNLIYEDPYINGVVLKYNYGHEMLNGL